MPEIDPIAYLASKGKHGRAGSGGEVAYPCFFSCGEPDDSRKRKLYVNAEEGFYTCFVCGESGGSYKLQKHFGDDPKKPEPGEDPHIKRKILNWAAEVGSVMLSNNDDLMLHLINDRGLSPETIVERKLGWVGNNWSLTQSLPEEFTREELKGTGLVYRDGPRAGQDFFYEHFLLPYLHRGHVVQLRGRATGTGHGGKYLTGPGEPVRLFGIDDLDGAEDVIITEGEFDAMVLKQHLQTSPDEKVRKVAVVALAGANGFKDGFESYFTEAKRIFLGLDPDDTGKREAIKIKEKLGARARILELPEELPKADWSEFLLPIPLNATREWHDRHPHAGHTWRDVVALFGQAAGKRVFSIRDAGTSWRNQKVVNTGLKTGFAELDATILPGCLPGQVMFILAKTGTGKTIVLCNIAYNQRAHRVLFISLEMTREEVYERLQRIYRFWHPLASDDEVEHELRNIYICDENRLSERDFLEILDEFTAEVGAPPEAVYVDYLGYFARGQSGNSQYEKVTNAAMQLKAMAKSDDPSKRFFLISPAQVNRGTAEGKPIDIDDARDSGAIEETADFLLSIWRPDDALQLTAGGNAQPTGKLKCTVLKSRHGGKDTVVDLQMDLLTLAVVDAHSKAARRAKEHNYALWRGTSYEALRAFETAPTQLALRHKDA